MHTERAADLVGDLADAIADLGRLLDKVHENVSEKVWGDVIAAFPIADQIGNRANEKLVRLMRDLTPPDERPFFV